VIDINSNKNGEKENPASIELLADPIRSRIFFEITLNKEVSTGKLLEQIKISKGTMSHHLSKLVKAGLLKVRIQSSGRPMKYYSLKTSSKILKGKKVKELMYGEETKKKEKVRFFQSATVQLQMISNLMKDTSTEISKNKIEESDMDNFAFTMQIFSSAAASVAKERFSKFIKDLNKELKEIEKESDNSVDEPLHFLFSGIFPILREKN